MYVHVLENIKNMIINGEFPVDQPLPSQKEFADIFNTSEITSRRALTELANEGYIFRIRGKGSFIKKIEDDEETKKLKIKRVYFVYPDAPLQVLTHRFYQDLMDGIFSSCKEKGIQFLTWKIGENEKLPDDNQAGFIVLPHVQGAQEISVKTLETWKMKEKRLVTVHFYYPHLKIPYVVINNITGGYLATQHLISCGHEKIGIILTGKSFMDINQEFSLRMEGYKSALLQHQIEFDPSYIYIAEGNSETEEMGYKGMKALLSLTEPPTAVFATSDYKAIGAIRAAIDSGLKVPEDISIVGFDDISLAKYSTPPLTTFNQNSQNLGKRAVEILVEEYNKKENEEEILKDEIVPELIIRESTRKR
ncbi:GntR family transcriptional regulator [Bacillus sp. FJAT-49870]|uniref:GntR family transcriptional regulator n=2 Tax=Lederbergia citri TaxID=2833580 RepID=A0A942YIZ8_9BACI|nr:GntR family transcriptional regulator [Lederbergia citri]